MEKPPLVRYEQNKDTRFFVCRQCKTHLSLLQEMLYRYPGSTVALFRSMLNVDLFSDKHPLQPNQSVAAAFCINCESQVGDKFIDLKIETPAIRTGRFMIDTTKLLLWNGNHMVYADTGELVESA